MRHLVLIAAALVISCSATSPVPPGETADAAEADEGLVEDGIADDSSAPPSDTAQSAPDDSTMTVDTGSVDTGTSDTGRIDTGSMMSVDTAPACTPTTTACPERYCGTYPNGCGGKVTCASCPRGPCVPYGTHAICACARYPSQDKPCADNGKPPFAWLCSHDQSAILPDCSAGGTATWCCPT